MGRVTTNSQQMAVAREQSAGVLPAQPGWLLIEPNGINNFGKTITKTARSPISKSRSRRKGTPTDAESSVEFAADLTLSHLRDFIEGFAFSRLVGAPVYAPTAVAVGGYTVPAVSAADAAKLHYAAGGATSLVFARGYTTEANNGLFELTGAVAADAVLIPVAGRTAEAVAATQDAELAVAGIRCAAGDIDVDAQGNLTSVALDFTTLGLTPGQFIHVGGIDVVNRFTNEANYGFARVEAIAANKLTLAKRSQPFVAEADAATRVDLLFGQYVRNVDMDHADYLEVNYQFELESPNLGDAGEDMYEYSLGNWADAISIELPLTDKATVTYGFKGLDCTDPATARAANAASAKVPSETAAFGTSSDIARLRMQEVDETGLTTDFKSLKLTMTNNVAGEKVLGKLGPKFMTAGNFEVDVESQVVFTNHLVITRIRDNSDIGLDFGLRNDDGGAYFDFPAGTLEGGGREFPENQSVLLNATLKTHNGDPVHKHSFSCSLFPSLPPNE